MNHTQEIDFGNLEQLKMLKPVIDSILERLDALENAGNGEEHEASLDN